MHFLRLSNASIRFLLCPSRDNEFAHLQSVKLHTIQLFLLQQSLLSELWTLDFWLDYCDAINRTCSKQKSDLCLCSRCGHTRNTTLNPTRFQPNSTCLCSSALASTSSDYAPESPSRVVDMQGHPSPHLARIGHDGSPDDDLPSSPPRRGSSPLPASSASHGFHYIGGRPEAYSDQGAPSPVCPRASGLT